MCINVKIDGLSKEKAPRFPGAAFSICNLAKLANWALGIVHVVMDGDLAGLDFFRRRIDGLHHVLVIRSKKVVGIVSAIDIIQVDKARTFNPFADSESYVPVS